MHRQNNQQNSWNAMPQQMQQQMQQYGKIEKAFQQNTPLIDRNDFTNKSNVLHNNLGEKIMAEYVNEYKIHINSIDRNVRESSNPFQFKTYFGLNSNYPLISQKFKNIKYVTLDSVLLPRCISVVITEDDEIYPAGSTYVTDPVAPTGKFDILENYKYLIVKIDELSTSNNLGTSSLLSSDTFMIMYDFSLGYDSAYWKPVHNNRVIFQNSALGTISRFTISLLDPQGNVIKLINNNDRRDLIGPNNFTDGTVKYFTYLENNTSDQTVYTNSTEQVEINLTFGVVENELNTQQIY